MKKTTETAVDIKDSPKPKRFVALVRAANDRQPNLLEAQVEELQRYAESEGGIIEKTFKSIMSATGRQHEKVLDELLAYVAVNKGRIDGLLVMRLDRLTRNYLVFARVSSVMANHGVPIIPTIPEDETPATRMQRCLNLVSAKTYVRELSVRVRRTRRPDGK